MHESEWVSYHPKRPAIRFDLHAGKDAGGQPSEVEGKPQAQGLDVVIAGDPSLTKTYLPQEYSVKGPREVEGKPHAQELCASIAGLQVEMP